MILYTDLEVQVSKKKFITAKELKLQYCLVRYKANWKKYYFY